MFKFAHVKHEIDWISISGWVISSFQIVRGFRAEDLGNYDSITIVPIDPIEKSVKDRQTCNE